MRTPLRAVLFDWDGTLADSAEATFRCYRQVFTSFGLPFDRDRFQATYSPNWHLTYRALGLDPAHWDDADARWLEAYACQETSLLPGAREALERLAPRVALGLVTSGDHSRVSAELQRLGLSGFFRTAVFGQDVSRRKPDPQGLLIALDRLGLSPTEAAYVGDSPEDVGMAQAAGALAVAVPGGYPNRDALRAAAPDVWCDHLTDVLERLEPLL